MNQLNKDFDFLYATGWSWWLLRDGVIPERGRHRFYVGKGIYPDYTCSPDFFGHTVEDVVAQAVHWVWNYEVDQELDTPKEL